MHIFIAQYFCCYFAVNKIFEKIYMVPKAIQYYVLIKSIDYLMIKQRYVLKPSTLYIFFRKKMYRKTFNARVNPKSNKILQLYYERTRETMASFNV